MWQHLHTDDAASKFRREARNIGCHGKFDRRARQNLDAGVKNSDAAQPV